MGSRTLRHSLEALFLVLGLALSSVADAKTHLVSKGDSLWSLARQYNTSVEALQKANSLGDSDKIRTGQKLSIPGPAQAQSARNTKPAKKRSAAKATKTTAKTRKAKATKTTAKTRKAKPKKATPATPKLASRVNPKKATPKSTASSTRKPKPKRSGKKAVAKAPSPPKSARGRVYTRVGKKELARAEKLYADRQPAAPDTLSERAPRWVLRKPSASTQVAKSDAARGGIYPCSAPDRGFGKYEKWVQVAPMAHVLAPAQLKLTPSGGFDVMFHFHGREPLRKEWTRVMEGAVLVAVDAGIDSGSYAEAFADARTFRQVLLAVEQELARRAGVPRAKAERVGLSAWSAGYGALEQILSQPFGKQVTDSVVLLDGLHAGYTEDSLESERLRPFAEFAAAAARGEKFMFVSHSSILTSGYASTTETAQYLVWKVGGKPLAIDSSRGDPWGLERISTFSEGQFHVRGFRGNATADHCAHIGLMSDILRVHLKPRWAAPAPEPRPARKTREALAFSREPVRPRWVTGTHAEDELAEE